MNPARRRAIFRRLQAANPHPTTELLHQTPFELLVAVMLSAHTTDKSVNTATRSLWRYRMTLPMQVDDPITMGEGCTPLIGRSVDGAPVLLKCEWFMPTGSFKDRGASVMLSLLRAQGVRAVLEDSSGNGGAAISAYAAAGGLKATIMAPASTARSCARSSSMVSPAAARPATAQPRGRTSPRNKSRR